MPMVVYITFVFSMKTVVEGVSGINYKLYLFTMLGGYFSVAHVEQVFN